MRDDPSHFPQAVNPVPDPHYLFNPPPGNLWENPPSTDMFPTDEELHDLFADLLDNNPVPLPEEDSTSPVPVPPARIPSPAPVPHAPSAVPGVQLTSKPVYRTPEPIPGEVPLHYVKLEASARMAPMFHYGLEALNDVEGHGVIRRMETAYAHSGARVAADLARSALYKGGIVRGGRYMLYVDFDDFSLPQLRGVRPIRAFKPDDVDQLIYCLPDVLSCMDYVNRASAACAMRGYTDILPIELQLRLFTVHKNKGGRRAQYGDIFVVKALLLIMAVKGAVSRLGSELRRSFNDSLAEEFATHMILGRLCPEDE